MKIKWFKAVLKVLNISIAGHIASSTPQHPGKKLSRLSAKTKLIVVFDKVKLRKSGLCKNQKWKEFDEE
jgi:hypothetical protein